MIRPEVDANAIKALVTALKEIDPGLARQLGKDLKSDLSPFASAIQSAMPTESPLSGMVHAGRTGWSPAIVKVSATPGAGWGKSIARIVIDGKPPLSAALKIAEFIGSRGKFNDGKASRADSRGRSYTINGQGRAMAKKLEERDPLVKGRGGRYGFAAYYKKQPEMLKIIGNVIDRFVELTNKRFD